MSDKPSAAWYLAPIFLGIIGSAIMWYVLKDEDHPDAPKMVKKGWIIGIVLTLISFAWIPLMLIPFAFMGMGQQQMHQPPIPETIPRLVTESTPQQSPFTEQKIIPPETLTPPPKQAEISPPKQEETPSPSPIEQSSECSGSARCFTGIVTQIIDGDTMTVAEQSIRFALTDTPELNEFGGVEARNFIEDICFVGSSALVDEDDGQTEGSYGRIVGVIYCNGVNLNEAILDADLGYLSSSFCYKSEFSNTAWAQKHGCPTTTQSSCDPSYPDFCIPPSPPDLDCKDIAQKRFTVIGSDPHRFDGDGDGIGCESG